MELIIGIILAIIALTVIGLILRKRVYDNVDRLESWKLDIMSRNVASQLGQIKTLNLSGETLVRFEAWKERWDYIVSKELADIEEHLLDAEEAADRFMIPKGKRVLKEAEEILNAVESSIEKILNELDDLLESEKVSRQEVEELEPEIKELYRMISQNRYQYGKADDYFETEIKKLEEKIATYYQEVDEGNYIEAKHLVTKVNVELVELKDKIKSFPDVYKNAKHELPSQIDNLRSGIKEMRSGGYYIEHLNFEKDIPTYEERLTSVLQLLEEGKLEEAKTYLDEINEKVTEMYDQLEKEAIAKNYIEEQLPNYNDAITNLATSFEETKEEVEHLKRAYYIEDAELEKFFVIGKRTNDLREELQKVMDNLEENSTANTEVRQRVEAGLKQIEELEAKHKTFKEAIQSLRKDELAAKDKIIDMRNRINELIRRLRKSNIPGVPTFIWTSIEEAEEKVKKVLKTLQKQPLDTSEVHRALAEADNSINHATDQIDVMLDQAYLTEQVIQYANRYRSRNPILAAKLLESERLFRAYEYELSLEQAAKAIEEVEPGALKYIEENQLVSNS
ncbi:septation ring formation regulator EzrA [Oceanobacillus sp. CAU 1775]